MNTSDRDAELDALFRENTAVQPPEPPTVQELERARAVMLRICQRLSIIDNDRGPKFDTLMQAREVLGEIMNDSRHAKPVPSAAPMTGAEEDAAFRRMVLRAQSESAASARPVAPTTPTRPQQPSVVQLTVRYGGLDY